MKTKETLVSKNIEEDVTLALQNNITYQSKIFDMAEDELNIRKKLSRMISAVEMRFGQIFDTIQENPGDIDTRVDRLFTEYIDKLGSLLEKYYKFTESHPETQYVQNNYNVQYTDQSILVFQEAIKEILAEIDLDSSMRFMEILSEKLKRLKLPDKEAPITSEANLAEVKLLNESISHRLG